MNIETAQLVKKMKVFSISFGLVFLMVALPKLGIRTPYILGQLPCIGIFQSFSSKCQISLVSPESSQRRIFDTLSPKLSLIKNDFKLKNPLSLVPTVKAQSDYEGAAAYVVINYDTGEVIASKNLNKRLPIASLTKVMTAVTALDLSKPDELFSVRVDAMNEPPTRFVLKEGQKFSLEELLNGSLLTSANDLTQVIKDGVNEKYSADIFIDAMNQKAKNLGLLNSHFQNPQGFDSSDNYSSAGDLAILSHYALENYPVIADIAKKPYGELPASDLHDDLYLNNWNGLMGVYPGTFGLKIGNTDAAGYTMIAASERGGKRVLVVMLGAPGIFQRDEWTAQLLDLGFNSFGIDNVNVTEQDLRDHYATWKYFN